MGGRGPADHDDRAVTTDARAAPRLPTDDAAVSVRVGGTLEALADVVGLGDTVGGGGLRRTDRALTGPTQEQHLVVVGDARVAQLLDEVLVALAVGEADPLDEDHLLAELGQLGDSDVRPFRTGADVDENRVRVLGEDVPCLLG